VLPNQIEQNEASVQWEHIHPIYFSHYIVIITIVGLQKKKHLQKYFLAILIFVSKEKLFYIKRKQIMLVW